MHRCKRSCECARDCDDGCAAVTKFDSLAELEGSSITVAKQLGFLVASASAHVMF